MTAAEEETLIRLLARQMGLEIALRDHEAALLAAARRAFALRAALADALPPEAEPAPAQRIEGAR
ncbi:hypothetical protein QMO56_13910 [Roseomonas sp. E05]|uniref:hypothetical protein n=1 Tax=Roseomonas sp. E05 TaxID=3046310 RepID=UPI0024B88019|nr:hypothetical protein [Roseomonas sp. E05]MDJ0389212.1 hypothetical protein [Roseomonas sp. E05]